MVDGMNRRRFLKVLGVTGGGAAVVAGCGIGPEPTQHLIPYLVQSEDEVPGVPTFYASTCRECAAGCGILVKTREGRAIKIEGNPASPINAGRLCARGQAALQGLYNPDRLTDPFAKDATGKLAKITWEDAMTRLSGKVRDAKGKGIAFITGLEASSFGDLVDDWMKQVGGRHVTYEPFAFEALREGNRLAFGTAAIPSYDFASAKYILSFGADFMETWLSPVAFQGGFSSAHGFQAGRDAQMAKFVAVSPRMSLEGLNADEWIAVVPGSEGLLALAMAYVIQKSGGAPGDAGRLSDLLNRHRPALVADATGVDAQTIERLAKEFGGAKGGLAVAGGMAAQYPNGAEIVAAVNILNYVAGNVGKTVKFGAELAHGQAGSYRELTALMADMAAGKVAVLITHGANPAYSVGGFTAAAGKVPFRVAFATMLDETASEADLVLPDLHPLEQWGDSRPRAGIFALQQPAMQPVQSNARGAGDVVASLAGKTGTFKDYVQAKWKAPKGQSWADAVQHGGAFGDAPSAGTRLGGDAPKIFAGAPAAALAPGKDEYALIVYPHYALYDGRGADKPWLQELPHPVSKIMWQSWVEVHPDTAATWAVENGDYLLIKTASGGTARVTAWVTPSIRPGVLAMPTGQGHATYGRYAQGRDVNAFDLLPAQANTYGGRTFTVLAKVDVTRDHRFLATLEGDPREGGESIIELLTLGKAASLHAGQHAFEESASPAYADSAEAGWAAAQKEKTDLGNYANRTIRWAMAIDLSKCTGCSACVTACYAENNIATVGDELTRRRRFMPWMRIERYFNKGENGAIRAVTTPMLCQQCADAPCEPVCPVFAAYHTPDGLNGQVYNRCVGTRYCANNCPYKVRFFNWFNYAERGGEYEAWPTPLDWQLNPDVTVREKGVMEKCTFCVQRIRSAQHSARIEDRTLKDGDIVPACAQGCPSDAIVFGDLNDPASRVHALSEDPRGYHVLQDLNTKPGITYLARVIAGAQA
ncbi:MAG TPA: molybdopterin-dependent oxidoreductase [Gemmatimonadales bacterium]|nr:molybdopterin-dependent oxidoreductase [Gemmatimonadales bacterium]